MSLSNDILFRSRVQEWVRQISGKLNYHSLELPDGSIIEGVIPVMALQQRLRNLGVPESLKGKRILDVGAASGWNSFELEKRGAEVVAVDCVLYDEFKAFHSIVNSSVDYKIMDVSEICPESVGTFDITFFLGVLYHLRHPLLALESLCAITREWAFVESYVIDSAAAPISKNLLEFYEIDELGGQIDNWFGVTTACLMALCRSAGFATVELKYSEGGRAGIVCGRKWPSPSFQCSKPAPHLISVVNNRSNTNVFHRNLDEYMCIYFRFPDVLTKEQLWVEVMGYGVTALILVEIGHGEWQANARFPNRIPLGQAVVQVRTPESEQSNSYVILVSENRNLDMEEDFVDGRIDKPAPDLYLIMNSSTGANIFFGNRSERVSLFFRSPEKGLSKKNIKVECDNLPLTLDLVIPLGTSVWQVNAKLPSEPIGGIRQVRVRTSESNFSDPLPIRFEI